MTENLLQKLEERMVTLLSEVEELRKDNYRLTTENGSLRVEREKHAKKLQDLILLLDTVNITETILQEAGVAA